MKAIFAMILAALTVITGTVSNAIAEQKDNRFTAERVFDLEYAGDPQISPDGRTIIYARKSMDRIKDRVVSHLWTLDTRSGAHRPLVTDRSVSSVRWSPSGDRIVYLAAHDGKLQLRIRYMDSGESFSVAQLDYAPGAPAWSPDGKHVAFTMHVAGKPPSFATAPTAPKDANWAKPVRVFEELQFRFDGAGYLKHGKTHVFVVSTDGGTARKVTDGDTNFGGPTWLDADTLLVTGNVAEDAHLDYIESEIYAIELSDLSMQPLTTRDGPDRQPTVSQNGRLIAYVGYDDQIKSHQDSDLYVMNADGSDVRNLTADYDRSIGSIAWRDGAIIAQVEVDGDIHLVSIGMNGLQKTIARDLGGTSTGRPYAGANFSVAAKSGDIAYTLGTADRPADVAYLKGSKKRTLTALNEDILPFLDMAKIEEIQVPSSHDGREIEAWIALPPGFKADGSYPMILEIHGGPHTMYGPFFAAEIQRFAAEGYVVVYVNPRGSTGYGEEFAQLIDLAYPGYDYDDLMSVVDAVIDKNYVDPKRLFVTGGSGGGLLTAWVVGKTDRFAAAVSAKPVINWTTMATTADIAAYVTRHWFRALPWEDRESYWRRSPLSLADNITTPTMLLVGEEDWRTPTWEAEQLYGALKLRKIDTALVRVPGASHSIAARPSRLISKTDNIMVSWPGLRNTTLPTRIRRMKRQSSSNQKRQGLALNN